MGVTSISGPGHLGRPQTLWPQEGLSLHRSEGFGRGMAEALQLDVDVIATAYGGNTDFCTGPPRPPRAPMATCGGSRTWSMPTALAAGRPKLSEALAVLQEAKTSKGLSWAAGH